jgi:hypothetical protein
MPAGQGNSTVDGWLDGSSPQPPERKRSTPNPCRGPPGFSERRVEPMKPCLGRRLNAIKHPASNRRHHHHPAHLSGVPLSTEQGRGLASATAASALRAASRGRTQTPFDGPDISTTRTGTRTLRRSVVQLALCGRPVYRPCRPGQDWVGSPAIGGSLIDTRLSYVAHYVVQLDTPGPLLLSTISLSMTC